MEIEQYRTLSKIHREHWFYIHRRKLLSGILDRRLGKSGGTAHILDFGAGVGANIPVLQQYGTVSCYEPEPTAVQLLNEAWPNCVVTSGRLDSETLREKWKLRFDAIVISYVLYHKNITDPESTLRLLAGFAKPGAILINMEPAFASLRRNQDNAVHGARRFTSSQLASIHERSGWQPMEKGYLLPSLFPAAWALARIESKKVSTPRESYVVPIDQRMKASLLNRLILIWLDTVDALLRKVGVPFGIGALTVSKKSGLHPTDK